MWNYIRFSFQASLFTDDMTDLIAVMLFILSCRIWTRFELVWYYVLNTYRLDTYLDNLSLF